MKACPLVLVALALPCLVPAAARAEDAPSLGYNIGVVSDYRYRGLSQSRLAPALQGGADYSHSSGLYVGTWASTIRWIEDAGVIAGRNAGHAGIEWDVYGGYKGDVAKGFSYDVGALSYVYPGNHLADIGAANANTTEVYGAFTAGPATVKYSHALTNLFGVPDSRGSGYFEASAALDLGGGWTVSPHYGHQSVRHFPAGSYDDYALGAAKDFGAGIVASASCVWTHAGRTVYVTPTGRFTGRRALVAGLKYSF